MPSNISDCAADKFVDWWASHWRSVIYSFLAGIFFTLACAWCSSAHAAGYTKPAGVPEIYLPSHGVTVSVFAAQTPVGHGIGVFELQNGNWALCGTCLVTAEIPTLDTAVSAAGGPGPYVASKLAGVNAVLAARYPAKVSGQVSTLDQVNEAVASYYVLRVVNGQVTLSPK